MKRFLSLIICIAVLSSSIICTTFAASYGTEDNKYMLMDFSNGMPENISITNDGYTVYDTENIYMTDEEKYTGSKSSLKLDYGVNDGMSGQMISINFKDNGMNTNFDDLFGSPAYTFTIRAKCTEGGGGITVYWCKDGNDSNGIITKNDFMLTANNVWEDISIENRNGGSNFGGNDDVFKNQNNYTIEGLVIKPTGSTGTVYIDSVYITRTTVSDTLRDYSDSRKCIAEWQTMYPGSASADTSVLRNYDAVLSIDNALHTIDRETGAKPYNVYEHNLSSNDLRYNYINMWIYAYPGNQMDLYFQRLYPKHTSNKYTITAGGDEASWQLVTIPVNYFNDTTDNIFIFNNGENEAAIRRIYLDAKDKNNSNPILIDSIWLSKNPPSEFKMLNADIPNQYVDEDLVIELSNKISPAFTLINNDTVEVIGDNGANVPAYTTEIKDNKLVVRFDDHLDYGASYKVNISSAVYDFDGQNLKSNVFTFATEPDPGDIRVKNIKFTNGYSEIKALPSEGEIGVEAYAEGEGKTAVLVLAIYNGNELESIQLTDETNISEGTTLKLTAKQSSFDDKTVKAFILSDLTNIKPLNINLTK